MVATGASCGRWASRAADQSCRTAGRQARSCHRVDEEDEDLEVRGPARSLALPFAQLLPVFQPLQDLALEAALDRAIEILARHAVRKVILARGVDFGVVVAQV